MNQSAVREKEDVSKRGKSPIPTVGETTVCNQSTLLKISEHNATTSSSNCITFGRRQGPPTPPICLGATLFVCRSTQDDQFLRYFPHWSRWRGSNCFGGAPRHLLLRRTPRCCISPRRTCRRLGLPIRGPVRTPTTTCTGPRVNRNAMPC